MRVRVRCGAPLRTNSDKNSELDMILDGFETFLCKSKCKGKTD